MSIKYLHAEPQKFIVKCLKNSLTVPLKAIATTSFPLSSILKMVFSGKWFDISEINPWMVWSSATFDTQ